MNLGLFKKKSKTDIREDKGEKIGAKDLMAKVGIDYSNIRVIPDKFLPASRSGGGRYKLMIIILAVLIIIVGAFGALLAFTDVLDKYFFGPEVIKTPVDVSTDQDNQNLPDQTGGTTAPEEEAAPEIYRKEVLGEDKAFAGAIAFEKKKELDYLDLEIKAIWPQKETLSDKNNNSFKIIGGVYSFEPGGVKLADGKLKVGIFYSQDLLEANKPGDLKVLNWTEEPEISFISGELKELENKMEIEIEALPQGNLALAILIEEATAVPTEPSEIEPVGAVPSSKDSDGDGLTDLEETLYGLDIAKSDSNGDGKSDEAEVSDIYAVKAGETSDARLKVYNDEEKKYTLYYPAAWTSEKNSEGTLNFSTGEDGELIRVMIQANPEGLSALDWYLKQASGVKAGEIKTGKINELEAAWSLDQLTAYIARDKEIYLINYNAGLLEEINFKATFDGMAKSFHFLELLIKSYKYNNDKHGFSLELPLTWKDYDIYDYKKVWGELGESDSLMFRLPTAYPGECNNFEKCATFVIDVFDFTTWDKARLTEGAPLLINVSNDKVFAYHKNTVYSSDLEARMQEIEGIVETFVLK